jgi:transcriptional regulator with XRE-family HTH domain
VDDPIAGLLAEILIRRLVRRHGKGRLEPVAELVGLSVRTLQRYANGESTPPPRTLALLAQKAGISTSLLARLRRLLEAGQLAEAAELSADPDPLPPTLAAEVRAAALAALEETADLLHLEPAPAPWEETGKPRPEDRRRAEELWQRCLRIDDRDTRYRLVRESTAFHRWSFAERLALESAAAASPAEAVALAELAVEIARKVRGTPSWRARLEAHALLHLGNAYQRCHDLDRAHSAHSQARKLQDAFSPSDPPLLAEVL